MTKWMSDTWLDYALTQLSTDAETTAILTTFPTTYFNCKKGVVWEDSTAISLSEVRYPPVWNGFVYECTVAGTTGSSEPPWGTVQDATFADGTVTWKTHESYCLVNDTVGTPTITAETFGKRLTFASTTGAISHAAGTVTHTAIISDTNQEVLYVTESETEEVADDDVLSGRIITINEIVIDRNNIA